MAELGHSGPVNEDPSQCMQLETQQSYSSRDDTPSRSCRVIWTPIFLGLSVFTSLGVSAWAFLLFPSHAPATSNSVSSLAFSPSLIANGNVHVHSSSLVKGLRPSIQMKHRQPKSRMQMSGASQADMVYAETQSKSQAAVLDDQSKVNALKNIELKDPKFDGNVAQYMVDLHDSKAVFNFCAGDMFQLRLSDMLRSHLVKVAKTGVGQPEVYGYNTVRMDIVPGYSQTGDADNIRFFQGRELRKVPNAEGGMNNVLQLTYSGEDPEGWSSLELETYNGWKSDVRRQQWRDGDMYEAEGWKGFKETYGPEAFGLNHRWYWHVDTKQRLWLSAEDGCEGVYPPERTLPKPEKLAAYGVVLYQCYRFLPQFVDAVAGTNSVP